MKHAEFHIGLVFYVADKRWRCTDMGQRVVVAISLDTPEALADPSWLNGPPYAVAECVFDENDLDGCSRMPPGGEDAAALRHYHLRSASPARPGATLEFDWDAENGSVSGRDAEAVQALCRQALADGGVVGHPYPTFHKVSDPLHSLRDMAVVLGHSWYLDAELMAAYPHPRGRDPDSGDFPEGTTLTF